MQTPVEIRVEEPRDHGEVELVHRLAFGGEEEARLVASLRASEAFVPELSLVAERGRRILGHILFTRIHIRGPAGKTPALALAPMAVHPAEQRRGIGSALVRRGLTEATKLGHRIVVVVGHPEYYPRFGFVPASDHGIKAPVAWPREAFLVLGLTPDALEDASGGVEYSEPFGIG